MNTTEGTDDSTNKDNDEDNGETEKGKDLPGEPVNGGGGVNPVPNGDQISEKKREV
jgi:hypothetical protein